MQFLKCKERVWGEGCVCVHSTQLQKIKRINTSADSDKKVTDYKMDTILNQSQYSNVK